MPRLRAVVTSLLATLIVVVSVCASGCARSESEPRVPDPTSRRVTRSGEVLGFQGRYGSHAWLGIPYAKPPVGVLRWRAPQPPDVWTGKREALNFGSPCTQFASPIGGVKGPVGTPVGSEDCLYLNVYAPQLAATDISNGATRLPVMVWIHGGGNTIGEAAFYNGGNLAVTERVIVVTLNYRLGPFGWFRHPALRGEGTSELDRSGNFGTLDLIRGLEWVRENISAFGGDPDNLTIFGESAGGTNVFTLLLSPRARGLFHRAIVESGGLHLSTVTEGENLTDAAEPGDVNSSNEVLLRLLAKDRTAADRAAALTRLAAMNDATVERYLRGKSNMDILSVYTPMRDLGMVDMPKVFRDGVVLPQEEPMRCLARPDCYNRVPVMLGTNRDENKLFLFADPARVRKFLWIFLRLRDEQRYNLSAEYMAKMWKATGADEPAAAMRAVQGPNVFVYRFDWDEEPRVLGADLSVMLGASHGFEIPFVFGHFDLGRAGNMIFTKKNEPGRMELAAEMMSYWAEFAYAGAPGHGRDGRLREWTPWGESSAASPGGTSASGTSPKFVIFNTAAGGGVRMLSDAVTRASVLAAIDADPRLPTQREKCMIFRELTSWSMGMTKKDYPTAGRNGCAAFPFDTYPW
ncbi:MAG: carboxylesterase/lipase family protein [Candidatus Binatia bacterium]